MQYEMSSYMYSIWCIHFVYHVQEGETPLLRAVNGPSLFRPGRCKVVKYFVEEKKMDITKFSQVMSIFCVVCTIGEMFIVVEQL